jgi:hypothetical protein
MKRICPNPMPWDGAFMRLTNYAKRHPCTPPSPPKPLILAGWVYSNDMDKMQVWEETITWAEKNGCSDLVSGISDRDFYFAENPTSYVVGPMGGPMGGPMPPAWNLTDRSCPSAEEIAQLMDTLLSHWPEIVGDEIGNVTRPLAFTGNKARRLLIFANAAFNPPWGSWSYLSKQETERRTFTHFRSAINKAISPHEVDHIDFTIGKNAEHGIGEKINKLRR